MLRTTTPRRLVCGVALILVWLGFVVEGSHALFNDRAALTGNMVTTGTVDLTISNSQAASSSTFADARAGFSYVLSPSLPEERYFILKNSSTTAVPMDIDVAMVSPSLDPELGSMLSVSFVPVDSTGTGIGTPVQSTLAQLMNSPVRIPGASIAQNSTQRVKVVLTLAPEFSHQNVTQSYDMVFTGTQHLGS